MDSITKIGCIVVLYSPDQSCLDKWHNIEKKESKIEFIFVDNTPQPDIISNKNTILFQHYHELKENVGIAKAQNIGIGIASKLGCEYIIFFDQDSDPSEKIIHALKSEFIRISQSKKIAAIGPKINDFNHLESGQKISGIQPKLEECEKIISSGTFTSKTVLDDVGYMEDDLFIDLVDHEWCWRAISKGYHIYVCNDVVLNHRIGKGNYKIYHYWLHLTSPKRYFFIYRNSRRMMFRKYVPSEWKWQTFKQLSLQLILIPFCNSFNGQKYQSIKYALKGIFTNKI